MSLPGDAEKGRVAHARLKVRSEGVGSAGVRGEGKATCPGSVSLAFDLLLLPSPPPSGCFSVGKHTP